MSRRVQHTCLLALAALFAGLTSTAYAYTPTASNGGTAYLAPGGHAKLANGIAIPPVGAPPHYMTGVGQIYVSSAVPCLPVALNSGLFWPRRTFMRYPGTLVVEFLDPLPAGLTRKDFIARIRASIATAACGR